MGFALEPRHLAFLEELRAYLRHLDQDNVINFVAVEAEYKAAPYVLFGPGMAFIRQLGKDGWWYQHAQVVRWHGSLHCGAILLALAPNELQRDMIAERGLGLPRDR